MSRPSSCRRLAVLLLALALALPWSAAAAFSGFGFGRPELIAPARDHHPFARFQAWLATVWEGCVIDPSGRCVPVPSSAPETDALDGPPAGRDEGCGIDPGGKPCN